MDHQLIINDSASVPCDIGRDGADSDLRIQDPSAEGGDNGFGSGQEGSGTHCGEGNCRYSFFGDDVKFVQYDQDPQALDPRR